MTDPDVRVVVRGLTPAERQLALLLRERRRVERLAETARRELERLDRELARIERELRR